MRGKVRVDLIPILIDGSGPPTGILKPLKNFNSVTQKCRLYRDIENVAIFVLEPCSQCDPVYLTLTRKAVERQRNQPV